MERGEAARKKIFGGGIRKSIFESLIKIYFERIVFWFSIFFFESLIKIYFREPVNTFSNNPSKKNFFGRLRRR